MRTPGSEVAGGRWGRSRQRWGSTGVARSPRRCGIRLLYGSRTCRVRRGGLSFGFSRGLAGPRQSTSGHLNGRYAALGSQGPQASLHGSITVVSSLLARSPQSRGGLRLVAARPSRRSDGAHTSTARIRGGGLQPIQWAGLRERTPHGTRRSPRSLHDQRFPHTSDSSSPPHARLRHGSRIFHC
jgi:hypothetical protein